MTDKVFYMIDEKAQFLLKRMKHFAKKNIYDKTISDSEMDRIERELVTKLNWYMNALCDIGMMERKEKYTIIKDFKMEQRKIYTKI